MCLADLLERILLWLGVLSDAYPLLLSGLGTGCWMDWTVHPQAELLTCLKWFPVNSVFAKGCHLIK